MSNKTFLFLFISLFFSACTSTDSQNDPTAVKNATKTEKAAAAIPTSTKVSNEVSSTTPTNNSDLEKPEEKIVVKEIKEKKSEIKPEVAKDMDKELSKVEKTAIKENKAQPEEKETPVLEEAKTTISTSPVKERVEEKVLEQPVIKPKSSAPAKPNHANWNSLLTKYVNGKGDVNYAGFKADKSKLQTYLDELSNNPPESTWSRNEKMAFWINAYNAYTIKLILDNYPTKSITSLKGGKPWDVKWIKIGTETYSLNNIENDILRPKYKDARIHFAVNCAAESCPPLLNKAWTAAQLNNYFEKQAKSFINNPAYNKITANKVQVSKIFDWYKEDFDNLIDYLNKYSNTKIKANAKVEFLDYDWALNKQ